MDDMLKVVNLPGATVKNALRLPIKSPKVSEGEEELPEAHLVEGLFGWLPPTDERASAQFMLLVGILIMDNRLMGGMVE